MTIVCVIALFSLVGWRPDTTLVRRTPDEEWDDEHAEQSAWLRDHPLDLNAATLSELEEIPGITAGEILSLGSLRGRLGRFSSVENIRILGEDLYHRIREYSIVTPRVGTRRRAGPAVRMKAERVVDGTSSEILPPGGGSGWRLRGAMDIPLPEAGSARVAVESDPGEQWKYGFVSASADLQGRGPVTRVLLGDYRVSAGQGLALSGPGYFSATTDPGSLIRPPARTLIPHRSFGESGFFRGIAMALGSADHERGIQATLFLSRVSLAASTDEQGAITSIDNSGFARTGGEIRRQHAVREAVSGMRVAGKGSAGWNAGGSVVFHGLDRPVAPDEAGGRGRGSGRVLGLDASFVSPSWQAAGEMAVSRGGGKAWILSLFLSPAPSMRLAAGWRVFEPGCRAPFGILSPGSGGNGNERGGTLRWELRPAAWCVLAGSADVSRSITGNSRERVPRETIRFVVSAEMRMNPATEMSVRLRAEESEHSMHAPDSLGRDGRRTADRWSEGARVTLVFRPAKTLLLRTRFEFVRVRPGGERPAATGVLIFNECGWSPVERISVMGRITLTDVISYEARVYAAETDSEGVTRVSMHSRTGVVLSARARFLAARGVRVGAGILWRDVYAAGGGPAGAHGFSTTEVDLSLSLQL